MEYFVTGVTGFGGSHVDRPLEAGLRESLEWEMDQLGVDAETRATVADG